MAQVSLARDILRETTGDSDENPLGLLGLSPEVLSLNLSDDELHSVCRRFAKSLLAEVHEDRVLPTERTRYLQARFSGALMLLRNKGTFNAALTQFRNVTSKQKSERSRDNREVHELRKKLRQTIADIETKQVTEAASNRQRLNEALAQNLKQIERREKKLQKDFKTAEGHRLEARRKARAELKQRRVGFQKATASLADKRRSLPDTTKRLRATLQRSRASTKAMKTRMLAAVDLLKVKIEDGP